MSRRELANAIRALSMDAVQKANSGHPGAPMGMADIAEVLWNDFLKHNPGNPHWYDRDRFVLSNGHASMLLYSLLHLTGYDLPLSELKTFASSIPKPRPPGTRLYPGVETTTGPLGQGWPTPSAWRLPSARWRRSLTVPAMTLSITIPGVYGRWLSDGGISTKPARWRGRWVLAS